MAKAGGMPSCLHCHLLAFVSNAICCCRSHGGQQGGPICSSCLAAILVVLAWQFWPKLPGQKPPRMQQGNLNRRVHLAVLHDMGVHQEASQHIQRVRSRSNGIDQLHQGHWWNIYQYGQDLRFGDFQATMATAAAIKICVASCPAYSASM